MVFIKSIYVIVFRQCFPFQVLNAGSPYPLVVLPVTGDYWQEGTNHVCDKDKRGKDIIKKIDESKIVIEDDLEYSAYKNFFKNQVNLHNENVFLQASND